MRIVFGLGNPGTRYQFTRHNIGFILLDHFADRHKLNFNYSKKEYYFAGGELNSSVKSGNFPFALIKPTTYVNLSGNAALDVISEYKINIEDFLIVYDDINLESGQLRIRLKGGDGGHNGIRSVISQLNSDQFPRIRFGIGRNFEQGEMVNYVLGNFSEQEYLSFENSFHFGVDLIEKFIENGSKGMLDFYSSESGKYLSEK